MINGLCVIYSDKFSEEQYEDTIPYNTDPYKNSFFVKSILHWNQLEDRIVCANTVECFEAAHQHPEEGYWVQLPIESFEAADQHPVRTGFFCLLFFKYSY